MGRMTKEGLQAKIKKAEERVVRTGEAYNAACKETRGKKKTSKKINLEKRF